MKKIYFLFIALLITSLTFGQELLSNGNFETWTDANTPESWTKIENVTQESTEAHTGNFSAKHTADGTKDLGQTITGITPGNSYTVSMWYKVESGDDTDARIWSYWKDDMGDNIADNSDELRGPNNSYFDNNGNQWTQYSVTLTAPATAAGFYFEARAYGSAVVYWDDFSFFQEVGAVPALSVTSPADGASVPNSDVDVEISVQNFNVAAAGSGDGYIVYSVDGGANIDKFDTAAVSLSSLTDGSHTVDFELVDNSGASLSPDAVTASVTFDVTSTNQVSDITALRAGTLGEFYELTGEAIISYIVTEGNRNQKYIQDSGAGILIDDVAGTLSTAFNIGDGLTGIKGQLSDFNGTLQFVPSENIATASSTDNTLTPIVISAADLINNGETYESRLITLNNVTFTDSGVFEDNTNYDVADGTDVTIARVAFGDEDLIGTAIPAAASSITGIGGQFNDDYQIFPRYVSDIAAPLSTNQFNTNSFSIYPNPTNTGSVSISSTNSEVIKVQVFDILGKQVKNQTLTNNSLNVASLKSGVYIVKITQNNASTTKKLVIK
ncbi:T9SS type A sorting domain-containing protein [Winogradskyella bathintestinalis]|uniref:T9SS type A sorting domain-containing protein n=1 Tax=Winogradskyella bathintestinalis TaxID=3035208 RepID=A0ABT7ZQU0_9FLAO|nr:T9SS type A sorting domain-containing protein [Winogradskyella bathintestinalis]MDN3491354.1 T9SS type A sorting domain-containing protein [Winogradskyella bathintestinalis]